MLSLFLYLSLSRLTVNPRAVLVWHLAMTMTSVVVCVVHFIPKLSMATLSFTTSHSHIYFMPGLSEFDRFELSKTPNKSIPPSNPNPERMIDDCIFKTE